MTTENQSVLEKLKEWQDLNLIGRVFEYDDTKRYWELRAEMSSKIIPRLISALETVEAKAAMAHSSEGHSVGAYTDGCNDGELECAREVLAVLNGEGAK